MKTSIIKKYVLKFFNSNKKIIDDYNNLLGISALVVINDLVDMLGMHESKNKNLCYTDISDILEQAFLMSIECSQIITDSVQQIICQSLTCRGKNADFLAENSIQKYFQEVNRLYEKNNNEYDIPFTKENREKIITMNLKTVIAVAKNYTGLGVPLDSLISAGNEGLVRAFSKFNPERAVLKNDILKAVMDIPEEKFPLGCDDINNIFNKYIKYGSVNKKIIEYFRPGHQYTRSELTTWINKNIFNAKFNSVATMWIKAYILQELNTSSQLIKKSKADSIKNSKSGNDIVIRLSDIPYGENSMSRTYEELLRIEDDDINDVKNLYDREANCEEIKKYLTMLLTGVKPRDKKILLYRFGIGLPRAMTTQEISMAEGLSDARVSQVVNHTLLKMKNNAEKYNVDKNILIGLAEKL